MAATQVSSTKRYLSNEDLAERFDVPVSTVRDWRRRGIGPTVTKLGGLVRYAIEDVTTWERSCREDASAR